MLIKQPGYNKRVRAQAPQIISAVNAFAFSSNAFGDRLWFAEPALQYRLNAPPLRP